MVVKWFKNIFWCILFILKWIIIILKLKQITICFYNLENILKIVKQA